MRIIAALILLVACTTTAPGASRWHLSGVDAINAAIADLPAMGGMVVLPPGDYVLTATTATAAVVIDRDNVTLRGSGPSTRLLMADNQGVTAVEIWGANVTVSDMFIDCNQAGGNQVAASGDQWDLAGVRSRGPDTHDVTVTRTEIVGGCSIAAHVWGDHGRITHNKFGNTRSDTAELVGGEVGWITDNLVRVDGVNAHGLGTDSYDQAIISNNIVIVEATGTFQHSVFRTWWGTYGHSIMGNMVVARGPVGRTFWILGYHNQIVGNSLTSSGWATSDFEGGASVITGNHFSNHILNISPNSPSLPNVLGDNVLINSTVNH